MTKKKKLTLIITGSILAAIILTACILIIVAHSRDDKTLPCGELATWQSMIKDDALLKDVVTPGAHDAGTKGLPYFAATQDRDTDGLLRCGTRYFDLRVSYANGKLLIYHGPSKGAALATVLEEVFYFLKSYPSETVILDFQHFEERDNLAQNGSKELLETKLGGMLVKNETDKDDVAFIDGLTLGQTRGKCLVVWGRETENILAENYVFKRNNDGGTRENSVIHSYYESSLNKKSSQKYVSEALEKYIGEYKKTNSGLFVLQGQLTDGLFVFGPRFKESTHTDNMNSYVLSLKDSNDLQYINIIMRDFVSPRKNCFTLQLNVRKDLVKTDKLSDFNAMLAIHI